MKEIYKVDIKDAKYWTIESNNGVCYCVRTDKPCHLYVRKANIIFDKMLCNYECVVSWGTDVRGVRIREYGDFVVIEPSGIKVPKSDFTLVKKPLTTEEKKESIDPIYLTQLTYICNLIAESNKGKKIFPDEPFEYLSYLMAQRDDNENPSFMSNFEFLYTFIYFYGFCNENIIDKKALRDLISYNEKKIEYFSLLWNVRGYGFKDAYDLLEYVGVIYPDLDDENIEHIDLDKFTVFEPIIKKEYQIKMNELVEMYIDTMKKNKNGK